MESIVARIIYTNLFVVQCFRFIYSQLPESVCDETKRSMVDGSQIHLYASEIRSESYDEAVIKFNACKASNDISELIMQS